MSWSDVRPILLGGPLVLAAWGAAMVALTLVEPAGTPVAVVAIGGMKAALRAVIAADGSLVQVKGDSVIAISSDPAFVRHLYREGALVVVAASPGGCIVVSHNAALARKPAPPIPHSRPWA